MPAEEVSQMLTSNGPSPVFDPEAYAASFQSGVVVDDPHHDFARLRSQRPVHEGTVAALIGVPEGLSRRPRLRHEAPHFSAFSYETVHAALQDHETFSNSYYEGVTTDVFGRSILEMVGDEHRRHRALIQPAFGPGRVPWWVERWITPAVEEAVDRLAAAGEGELSGELCHAVPLRTITSSLGLSAAEANEFSGLYQRANPDPESETRRRARLKAVIHRIAEDRRNQEGDDLMSVLVASRLAGEHNDDRSLSAAEIESLLLLLMVAGLGTVWRQLGILLAVVLSEPEIAVRVREDPEALSRAIEEVIRWEPTDPVLRRLVTRDTVLGGTALPTGAVLELNLAAANRDPERWDAPDLFDLDRVQRRHVGFSAGPHTCLGTHVARAQLQLAATILFDRLPKLRLKDSGPPPRIIGLEHRCPTRILVTC